MALSDLIRIEPIEHEVHAELTVPGSKSITNRALVLAALSQGVTVLEGALWSEDTQVMVDCLRQLGFIVEIKPDPAEAANRTITVHGRGGVIPRREPIELFVGNAGTAARFLAALVCLGEGPFRLHGVPRMHERPQKELFDALRELGCRVDSEKLNDKLPVVIRGRGPVTAGQEPRKCTVSIESSSQFASALLLCARTAGWQVEVLGVNAMEAPYVTMTRELVEAFPREGGRFQVEADASSASYFVAANALLKPVAIPGVAPGTASDDSTEHRAVVVRNWPTSKWQVDANFPKVLQSHPRFRVGLAAVRNQNRMRTRHWVSAGLPEAVISRQTELGDSIMMAIVLSPMAAGPVEFTDLGRLRLQECERVTALKTQLAGCGAHVEEQEDTLIVFPSHLHAADIETYNDHRMAMCFAILGLKVPGIGIKNAACVKKTFPNFFQKLAAPPPAGLGAVIRHGRTGRELSLEELFAG